VLKSFVCDFLTFFEFLHEFLLILLSSQVRYQCGAGNGVTSVDPGATACDYIGQCRNSQVTLFLILNVFGFSHFN
jgi:hypothetical protein